jgi:AraC-like DNA-binding protein
MVQPSFPVVTESDAQLPLYLTSIGYWEDQERTVRPEGFPDYQWLQAVAGTGELAVSGVTQLVKPGQGFFLNSNEPHAYRPLTHPWGVHWIAFNGSLMPSLMRQAGMERSGVYSLSDPESIILHMKTIYAMSLTGRPFLGMECSKLLYAFLLDLVSKVRMNALSVAHNSMKLQPVIQFIEENCHRAMTIGELSGCIGVSPQYLCQLFKSTFKMRPMEYVNRERINKSKELMFHDPSLKLQDIAVRVGFDSPSYFSSVFRKIEGVSPEHFRSFGYSP